MVVYKTYSIGGDEPVDIVADYQNKLLWYTTRVHYGANTTDKVGNINLNGSTQEWNVPSLLDGVWGITADEDGRAWFAGGTYFTSVNAKGVFGSPYQLPDGGVVKNRKEFRWLFVGYDRYYS